MILHFQLLLIYSNLTFMIDFDLHEFEFKFSMKLSPCIDEANTRTYT